MDRAFLIEGLKALLPITLIFTFIFTLTQPLGDYAFHMANYGQQDYPPAVSWVMGFTQSILMGDRHLTVLLVQLFASTIAPYFLILYIVGRSRPEWRMKAGWVYLYGSGVPFILFFGGFIPQAFIQVLMLLSLAKPATLFLFLMVGSTIHREWAAAFLITTAYLLLQYMKPRLPAGWFD